jgi:hypothetical protein
MNCVYTVNIGGYSPATTLESHYAAAKRWNAVYCEINESLAPACHPSYSKVYAAFHDLKRYERLAFFDGDTVISACAPNVFTEHNDSNLFYAVRLERPSDPLFYAVRTVLPTDCDFMRSIVHWPLQCMEASCGVKFKGSLDNFFNGGVYVCSPQHHADILAFFIEHVPACSHKLDALMEQALLNIAVNRSGKLSLMDTTWNQTGRPLSGRMQNYVYHFTGSGGNRKALVDYWHSCPWKER